MNSESDRDDQLRDWEEKTEKFGKALERRPLRVFDITEADELVPEMEERLVAMLWLHGFEPSQDGWRDLAIYLLLKHEAAFQIESPVDRLEGEGGAETSERWFDLMQLRDLEKKLGSKKAAAREAAKTSKWSWRTLYNRFSEAERGEIKQPRSYQRLAYEMKAEEALRRAVQRVEKSER